MTDTALPEPEEPAALVEVSPDPLPGVAVSVASNKQPFRRVPRGTPIEATPDTRALEAGHGAALAQVDALFTDLDTSLQHGSTLGLGELRALRAAVAALKPRMT